MKMSAQFQCDECKGFYKSKSARSQHGRRTGHRVEANIASTGSLDDSQLKAEVATLSDSIKAKDTEIATLKDAITAKEAEFGSLHDEIAQLASLEHEQDVVRFFLKKLTPDAFTLIGQQLGYTPVASIEDSTITPVAEPHPAPVASEISTDNQEKTSKLEDADKPAADDCIFIGEKNDPGWTYYKDMGFSLKDK
jgi:hypothetical protein